MSTPQSATDVGLWQGDFVGFFGEWPDSLDKKNVLQQGMMKLLRRRFASSRSGA
jgi:hypothetical protein